MATPANQTVEPTAVQPSVKEQAFNKPLSKLAGGIDLNGSHGKSSEEELIGAFRAEPGQGERTYSSSAGGSLATTASSLAPSATQSYTDEFHLQRSSNSIESNASISSAVNVNDKASPVKESSTVQSPAKPIVVQQPHTQLLAVSPTLPPPMQRAMWSLSDYHVTEKLYTGYASKGMHFSNDAVYLLPCSVLHAAAMKSCSPVRTRTQVQV